MAETPAKPRARRTTQAKPDVAPVVLSAEQIEAQMLANLDLELNMAPFSPEHVQACRGRFPQVPIADFITLMRKSKKLAIDPLSDVWITGSGTFIMRASAMFEYADRTGRYAPGSQQAEFIQRNSLKGPANPEGLVSCVVRIRVQTKDGTWHDCPGEAFWRDLVPLVGAKLDPLTGDYSGGRVSDATGWATMPSTMLRKCAFVDALKKAFPELGSFFIKEEMEQAEVKDAAKTPPTTVVAKAEPVKRVEPKLPSTYVNFLDGGPEKPVPLVEFFETVSSFLAGQSLDNVVKWFQSNQTAREDFWTYDKAQNGATNATKLKMMLDQAHSLKSTAPNKPTVSERATPPRRRSRRVDILTP